MEAYDEAVQAYQPNECRWCHRVVKKLDEHHYPIPEKYGGVDTVCVCPECHRRDEALCRRLIRRIKGGQLQMFPDDPERQKRIKLLREAMNRTEEEKKRQLKFLGD